MSENGGPKLFIRKPKKAQAKQSQGNNAKDFSPQQASSAGPSPAPVKESFFRRYKYLWPLLLTVNLAYGAYVYTRYKKLNASSDEETAAATHPVAETSPPSVPVSAPFVSTQASAVTGRIALPSAMKTSQNPHATLPAEQQREVFRWILEEKRKIKPKNAEEKERIDAEKAVLKQFIRADSIPTF